MRKLYASLFAGVAVLGMSTFAVPAAGKDTASHIMTVQLPGGGSAAIRYAGDVVPKVTFAADPFGATWMPESFTFEPSFAAMQQIAADMDRQMDAFWRQARTMASWPAESGLSQATLSNPMPGSSSYSVVSEAYGNNVCTRVTEITASSNGGKPKVASRTSGNCYASPAGALTAPMPGARTIADHDVIPATAVPRTAL